MNRRWRLIFATLAFVGWLSYLGYTALTKYRGPVISRIQAAASTHALVAEVSEQNGKPLKKVKVLEWLTGNGPIVGSEIDIENLPEATEKSGFTGPGRYLLLLTDPPYLIVKQQRSPGNDLTGVGPPLVYPWSDGLRKQFEMLPKQPAPPAQ